MRRSSGFSLLEVLIAMLLFSMIALSLGRLNQMNLASWSHLEARAMADIIASSAMEGLRIATGEDIERRTEVELADRVFLVEARKQSGEPDGFYALSVTVAERLESSSSPRELHRLESGWYEYKKP
ncbi:MAG: prepilin-type N-terminal cleavage/methylation domain-containing protein [Verrucomicrobiota bacterium]